MKTIKENNRIIAEFMGAKYNKDTSFPMRHDELWLPIHGVCNFIGTNGKCLRYDSSWDWLMPVIEKIEELEEGRFDVNILKNGTQIFEFFASGLLIVDNVANISFSEKIEHTYDAVVRFIEWYNKQKQIKP